MKISQSQSNKFYIIDIEKREKYKEFEDSFLRYEYKLGTPVKLNYDSEGNKYYFHNNDDRKFFIIPQDCVIEVSPELDPEYFI